MRFRFQIRPLALMALVCGTGLLAACGSSSRSAGSQSFPNTVIGANQALMPDGQGLPCQTGAGRTYNVNIPSPLGGGEMIGATVFEPTLMDCSQTYPLILWQDGFATPRPQSLVPVDTDPGSLELDGESTLENAVYELVAPLDELVAAGYGVITFDPRGTGTSGGLLRVQDPDYEGANVVRVVDWAETNLNWLAYGPSVDGKDPHNLMLGAIGPSYGGGFQNMLLAIDPKKRLDAMVPVVTWHDLRYSLTKNDVIKETWVASLGSNCTVPPISAICDPYVIDSLNQAMADNLPAPDTLQFYDYHSLAYFTDGQIDNAGLPGTPALTVQPPISVTTDGGPGTAPRLSPAALPPVNALYIQSPRDTLFNLNEAVASYETLKGNGADVRLFTHQAGHNTFATVSDTGLANIGPADPYVIYQPDPTSTGILCGGVTNLQAILAFFDEHLKGMSGQVAQTLGSNPICLSLTALDSVSVPSITHGGQSFPIAANASGNAITVGEDDEEIGDSQATTIPLLTVSGSSNVLAGIPTLDVNVIDTDNPADSDTQNTIIYIGIGQMHAVGLPGWDLVDNQLTPIRGLGHHTIDLSGVATRLEVGDQIGLMLFGANANQYPTSGLTINPVGAQHVSLQGSVQMPLLGDLPSTGP
jgi:ABC-2 type transport system ATP-binding protein